MFIGTQYYRPPHPAREDWDSDLRAVADAGLTVVRIWIYWSQVQPRPNIWVWDDVDTFFDAAHRHGLRVLAQLMPDAMPYWFKDRHPEALFHDAHGRPVQPSAAGSMAVGGVPGPNFDHPTAIAAEGMFLARAVAQLRQHPALYGWDIWNELWPFVLASTAVYHSEATVSKWRSWLQTKYGDIEALNRHWMRSYASFEEVEWPSQGGYADLGTRYLFDQERVAGWMRRRVEVVRAHDPDHRVMAHTGGIGPIAALNDPWGGDLTDPWLFTDLLDVWGTSCYLADPYQWSFLLDSTCSAAQGRPYWVFEMNGGRGHFRSPGPGLFSNYLRSAEEIRSQVLLAFSHGAEAAIFWQWRPESFGAETPGWGLTSPDGSSTDRTAALAGLTAVLKAHRALFDQAVFPAPQVGIVWEPRSYSAERLAGWRPECGYLGGFELFGYHKAFAALGLGVAYLHAGNIVSAGIPANIKVLIHPYAAVDRADLASEVARWVRAGGIFVAGPCAGMLDDRLNGSRHVPSVAWRAVLGVRQQECYYPADPSVSLLPGPLTGTIQRLPGYHLMEAYALEGAIPIGVWERHAVLTTHALGAGKAIAAGTFLGLPCAQRDMPGLQSWIIALCDEAGVTQPVRVTGQGVLARTAVSGDTLLCFMHNTGDTPMTAWITSGMVSAELTATDLVSGNCLGILSPARPICATVAQRDSTMVALSRDRDL